jgi:serine/threonine protein kinase
VVSKQYINIHWVILTKYSFYVWIETQLLFRKLKSVLSHFCLCWSMYANCCLKNRPNLFVFLTDMLYIDNWTFQDLVQKMLHVDPSRRLSATQVLNHSWVAQREELSDRQLVLNGPHLKVRVSDCCWVPSYIMARTSCISMK